MLEKTVLSESVLPSLSIRTTEVALWREFCAVFCYLPLAATVDDTIFCVHAGLSPSARSVDDIQQVARDLAHISLGFRYFPVSPTSRAAALSLLLSLALASFFQRIFRKQTFSQRLQERVFG